MSRMPPRDVTVKEHLLFLHSWSGFGKRKPKVVPMLGKSNEYRHLAETVSSPWNDQVDVGNAGNVGNPSLCVAVRRKR